MKSSSEIKLDLSSGQVDLLEAVYRDNLGFCKMWDIKNFYEFLEFLLMHGLDCFADLSP